MKKNGTMVVFNRGNHYVIGYKSANEWQTILNGKVMDKWTTLKEMAHYYGKYEVLDGSYERHEAFAYESKKNEK